VLLVFAGVPVLSAQSAPAVLAVSPQQCVWRAGDDPAWAAPGLDESAWKPMSSPGLTHLAHLWVRCRVPRDGLRGVSGPAIMIVANSAYEWFFDGVPAAKAGDLHSGDFSMDIARIYPLSLSPSASAPAVIALRLTHRADSSLAGFFVDLAVGSDSALRGDRARTILESIRPLLGYVILYCIIGVIGAIQLGLFWYDRARLDLLWLSLYCVFGAILRVNSLAASAIVDYPVRIHTWLYLIGTFSFIFETLFYFAVARKRIPWAIWTLYVLSQGWTFLLILENVVSPELGHRLAAFSPWTRHPSLVAWTLLTLAPVVAFWPWNRIPARLRPIAICCFLWALSDFVFFAAQTVVLDWLHQAERYNRQAIVLYDVRAIISAITIMLILALLFRDQRRITEERAMLSGEMQAAREIQQMLAPDQLPCAPGLSLCVAFRPMREVGGDFYLCRVLADGRQRILLGDVSGKGTAAAMTAALLLGGAEGHDSFAPGELLSHLDCVLRESNVGGFATCLCADVDGSGRVALANAGHLPPYRAGEELPTAWALPLGLSASENGWYEETSFELQPDDSITFLSDGVVEARRADGELFGFERTQAISGRSPQEIADAAQEFGQEDDITVLKLTLAPVAVLA
jgi:sigma-B regulation protein RsbU (phosphoserine phosphatase)